MEALAHDWKADAEKAIKAGYQPKCKWEMMLRRHLERYFPDLTKELKANGVWEAYLQTRTHHSTEEFLDMEEQGMSAEAAQELTLQSLLPTPPDEIDRPEEWEREAAQSDLTAATERYLSKLPAKNP